MGTRIGHSKCDVEKMKIVTDIRLWDYLLSGQQRSARRLSRMEAFFDLIRRQYSRLSEGEYFLAENVSRLARLWRWNRDTATFFLNDLEQLGVLTVDTVGNQKFVKLNYVIEKENDSGTSQKPSEPLSPSSATDST